MHVATPSREPAAKGATTMLYRVTEVMSLLKVSRPTIYRMIARKQLRLVKIGTASRITAESVMSVIGEPGNNSST